VCTDIIHFKHLKLNYFKGNYDAFEANDREMKLVQQRQHEAQMVKVQHMQEFVDKFRYDPPSHTHHAVCCPCTHGHCSHTRHDA
jgi:ATPase subunit of ABC transporter with duplicated ATPase domains